MTTPVPAYIPSSFIAGDTWNWTRTYADNPSPTWTVTVYFENKDGSFSAQGTSASNHDHAFSVAAGSTSGYRPGRYRWRARATDGTTLSTLESGFLDVIRDPAAAGNADFRTFASRTLEAVEAFLEGNATTAQMRMKIRDREIYRWPLTELVNWRDQLRQEVRTQEQATKNGLGRNIKVRFRRG